MTVRVFLLAGLLSWTAGGRAQASASGPRLRLWRVQAGAFSNDLHAGDEPMAVGSLQKPFVVQAWAAAHTGLPSPRFRCAPGDGCWFKAGHGELGLSRALAFSCNTYFRRLAEDTPPERLAAALLGEGFQPAPSSAEEAIGLPGSRGTLRIRPSRLLSAYGRLLRTPWVLGEPVRQEVLQGLRAAALAGTAGGLGHWGFWAKTGTVPAAEGDALRTAGCAIAVDDAGAAFLARLEPGTGREAAAALGAALARLRPEAPAHAARPSSSGRTAFEIRPTRSGGDSVTVRLFGLFRAPRFTVRNLGAVPLPAGKGFLGPGASRTLPPGGRVGPGLLEIRIPGTGLRRRLEGEVHLLPGRPFRLIATLVPKAYVEGVLAAELPQGSPELRAALAAAVLRFLARGRRHPEADVCDTTHCAWFVGQGPRLDWRDPRQAVALEDGQDPPRAPLTAEAWAGIMKAAEAPGPDFWTGHCGGRPLSPRALWGQGDTSAPPCPRHGTAAAPWVRHWKSGDLARAFGGSVERMEVADEGGIWTLRIGVGGAVRSLRYDQAHRRLAAILGWDALPSPADSVAPTAEGFRASGVGRGHRVGLCLGG